MENKTGIPSRKRSGAYKEDVLSLKKRKTVKEDLASVEPKPRSNPRGPMRLLPS